MPTPQALVDRMLDMAAVKPGEYVIDLGSGDGRLVIAAARRGARALGVEYNADLVEHARNLAGREGVAERARFVREDLFETDLSGADVITLFLLRTMNLRLRPKLLALKPGTRIVANTFDLGEWVPDETRGLTHEQGCSDTFCTAHLWIVPAWVAGTYQLPEGELVLHQQFQFLEGTLTWDGNTLPVKGRVRGEEVALAVDGRILRGKAKDGTLALE